MLRVCILLHKEVKGRSGFIAGLEHFWHILRSCFSSQIGAVISIKVGTAARARHKQNPSWSFIGLFPVAFSSPVSISLPTPSLYHLPPKQLKWKAPGNAAFPPPLFPGKCPFIASLVSKHLGIYRLLYFLSAALSAAPSHSPDSFEKENVYCWFSLHLIRALLQPAHLFPHCSWPFLSQIFLSFSLVVS